MSVGDSHSCGLGADGAVACWGSNGFGQAKPHDGTFNSVSSGLLHTCAVGTHGAVHCWGLGFGPERPLWEAPDGSFRTVDAGSHHTCGISTDGVVACWGSRASGKSTPPGGEFAAVSAGAHHTCGVRADGTVACWGLNLDGQSTPPDGTFTAVSAGEYHTCGIKTDGTTECWGRGSGSTPAPTAPALPCEDCRADAGAVRLAHTGGGVASRDDCRDDARTGQQGMLEGERGERVAAGMGRCAGWSYVTYGPGSWSSWIRDRYLVSLSALLVPDPSWQPPLPMAFCTIPPQPGSGCAVQR